MNVDNLSYKKTRALLFFMLDGLISVVYVYIVNGSPTYMLAKTQASNKASAQPPYQPLSLIR